MFLMDITGPSQRQDQTICTHTKKLIFTFQQQRNANANFKKQKLKKLLKIHFLNFISNRYCIKCINHTLNTLLSINFITSFLECNCKLTDFKSYYRIQEIGVLKVTSDYLYFPFSHTSHKGANIFWCCVLKPSLSTFSIKK